MMGRRWIAFTCLWLSACAHGGGSKGPEPSCCAPPPAEQDTDAKEQAGKNQKECPPLAPEGSTRADYEKGKELVSSCTEMCMKSEEGGAKRSEGLALLRKAAGQGDLAAQAYYGEVKFTDLMTTGFEPELEGAYVEAIYFLSLAARRGNTDALRVVPALETLRVTENGTFSEPLTEPLTYIEEGWVKAALVRVQGELPCYEK